MAKKLQKRFILISMLSFILVLLLVSVTINFSVNLRNRRNADYILEVLASNEGDVPKLEKYDGRVGTARHFRFTKDTPFEVRYFVVDLDERGNAVRVDTETELLDKQMASEYAKTMQGSGKTSGYYDKYRYLVTPMENGYQVIGLDCVRAIDSSRAFVFYTVIVVMFSLVVVFFLLIYFSRRFTEPIIKNIEQQKRFIADAGHEIKTPLTIISANNDILKINYGESEWTESIDNQLNRMDILVSQLLHLSTLQESEQEKKKTIEVGKILLQSVETFRILFERKNIQLEIDLEGEINLEGYAYSIENLFGILLDNMVKYTEEKGNAYIKLVADKKEILFTNSLSSPLEHEPERLFDRFYRREESRSRELGGNGIGLSIAKVIAKRNSAQLSATSDERSITFKIKFQ